MTGRLLGFLSYCLYGQLIYMNQSFLTDKLNARIGPDFLNVIDDALMTEGLASLPFDSEGVPCRKKYLIESGIIKSYLLDTYSANKLKMKSTGNAGGATNLYIPAGESSPEEIIKSVDKGLLLTSTIGQGTNPVTGDISTGAFGIWIEKGELAYQVAEITISGNLGKMLNGIQMIGSDLKFISPIIGPTLKIDEMTISGV
jgi:PmbA protein